MKKEHSLRWGNDYSTFEILQLVVRGKMQVETEAMYVKYWDINPVC